MASHAGDASHGWSGEVAEGGSIAAYLHHVLSIKKATNDDNMKMSVAEYKGVEAVDNLYA